MTTIASAGKIFAFSLLKVFLGLLTLSFFAAIVGQLGALWTFIALAAICTGGIGLLVEVPLALALGSLVLKLGYKLAKKPYPNFVKGTKEGENQSNSTTAIVNYINQAHASNMTDEEIKRILLQNGWAETDINQCFNIVSQPHNELPKPL